jgi:hypothetical protein
LQPANPLKNRSVLFSALAGFTYGLFCRLAFTRDSPLKDLWGVMTIGFLGVMPLAVGFISAFFAVRAGKRGPATWVGLPIVTTVALFAGSFVLFWEGIICLTMLLPLALVMAILGGALGGFCARRFGKTPLLCVAILPFVVSAAERWAGPAYEVREVATSIAIDASPAVVWRQIERVPPIRIEEQRFSWTQKIGFPRPIEATLSGAGVGAVRHATFAGGVLFIETVTEWDAGRRLGFDIRADTASIPPHTLDEHVTIGGRYFDTLHGEYRIEARPDGTTLLHLSSRHRLSTTFNFYARLWTDAVMRDIQDNILFVIRNRCEKSTTHAREQAVLHLQRPTAASSPAPPGWLPPAECSRHLTPAVRCPAPACSKSGRESSARPTIRADSPARHRSAY